MLIDIYSPEGEKFQVPPSAAKNLIVIHGWYIKKEDSDIPKKEDKLSTKP